MSKRANPPSKHHYIPECYLKGWSNTQGKLVWYRRVHDGKLHQRSGFPSQVGYKYGLYTAPGVFEDPWDAQPLETAFFSEVDNDAAIFLTALRASKPKLPPENLRSSWARFIMSLFFRTTQNFGPTMAKLVELMDDWKDDAEAAYQARRRPDDLDFLAAWASVRDPLFPEKSAYSLMPRVMDNKQIGDYMFNAPTYLVDTRRANLEFLTSDNPISFSYVKQYLGHIGFPISPTRFFLITEDETLANSIRQGNPRDLVMRSNRVVVNQAKEFVVAGSGSQRQFIERYFGSEPMGSLAGAFKHDASEVRLSNDD